MFKSLDTCLEVSVEGLELLQLASKSHVVTVVGMHLLFEAVNVLFPLAATFLGTQLKQCFC